MAEQYIDVEELKKKYEPKEFGKGGQVCVGGIFIAEWMKRKGYEFKIGEDLYTFPNQEVLGRYLREYNRNLSKEKARDFAERIISNNDRANFCDSWDALYEALNYGKEKPKKKPEKTEQLSIDEYLEKQEQVEGFLDRLDADMKAAQPVEVGAIPPAEAERKRKKRAEQAMLQYRRPVRAYRRGWY